MFGSGTTTTTTTTTTNNNNAQGAWPFNYNSGRAPAAGSSSANQWPFEYNSGGQPQSSASVAYDQAKRMLDTAAFDNVGYSMAMPYAGGSKCCEKNFAIADIFSTALIRVY